jgi:hypothetical protein
MVLATYYNGYKAANQQKQGWGCGAMLGYEGGMFIILFGGEMRH